MPREFDDDQLCRQHGVAPARPALDSKAGVALGTLHLEPLNGLRHPADGDACGWYLWGGDLSDDADFFQSLHVAHLADVCPRVVPYLALPPGWRFLLGTGEHVDVWHDAALLDV
jgi:hypothetical protein